MQHRLLLAAAAAEEQKDPHANLALEEAIFASNSDEGGLTMRLWENSTSVIIGRAQLARFETNLVLCSELGIPVVRRFTGGGAVYNGSGNLNWSVFVSSRGGTNLGLLQYVWDVGRIFSATSSVIIRAIRRCGIEAWLDPPNRIMIEGGKVCGMAAFLSKDGFVCHGTLLLHADLETASSLTEPAPAALERRYIRSRPTRIANLGIESDSFIASVVEVLREETGVKLTTAQPTEGERSAAKALLRKYTNPEWNLGDPFSIDSDVSG